MEKFACQIVTPRCLANNLGLCESEVSRVGAQVREGASLLEPYVLQISLQAVLVIHCALWCAFGSVGAIQSIKLLRLWIAGLPAEVASSLNSMQACFAHRNRHFAHRPIPALVLYVRRTTLCYGEISNACRINSGIIDFKLPST